MKKTLAIALAVVFVLAFAAPVFAQGMTHTVKEHYVDAQIDIERQYGHLCNTGAEHKYTVKGSAAEFEGTRAVGIVNNKITVTQDNASWVAGATPLTVTSVIELCMPAKHEWEAGRYVYSELAQGFVKRALQSGESVDPWYGYPISWGSRYYDGAYQAMAANWADVYAGQSSLFNLVRGALDADLDDAIIAAWRGGATWTDFVNAQTDGAYNYFTTEALTDQIWAVQVQSDAGFSGTLNQGWEATNGGWNGDLTLPEEFPGTPSQWGFIADADFAYGVDFGSSYVGKYFNMDQYARTSQGTLKRYVDVSSPWSHAYYHEDSTVTGKAEVEEAFSMINHRAGADVQTEWWELF